MIFICSVTKRLINGTSALPDKHSHDRQFEVGAFCMFVYCL